MQPGWSAEFEDDKKRQEILKERKSRGGIKGKRGLLLLLLFCKDC